MVDGQVGRPWILISGNKPQGTARHGEVGGPGHHIDMPRLQANAFQGFKDGHARGTAKYLGQKALRAFAQVLDHNKRHAGIARQAAEQLSKSLEPPCGCSDGNYGERSQSRLSSVDRLVGGGGHSRGDNRDVWS